MSEFDDSRFQEARTRLLMGLGEIFPLLGQCLQAVAQEAGFQAYLSQYRGLAGNHAPTEEVQSRFGESVVEFFLDLVSRTGFALEASSAPPSQVASALKDLEEATNLALYYWHAQDDRNFQFRTVVHFAGLDGLGALLLSTRGEDYYVSLSDDGVRFGPANDAHIPRMAPMAMALGLREFRDDAPTRDLQRRLFARLRTVQREICLLEEEWEHRNALLAVVHSHLREEFRRNKGAETEEALRLNGEDLGRHRDFLAAWCLSSFATIQEWLVAVHPAVKADADLASEWETVNTLILSGLQKIFLPASVSRHQYNDEVARLFLRWCDARMAFHRDDMATALIGFAIRVHLDLPAEHPRSILENKPFEWSLPYDPTSGLKTFCWRLPRVDHVACTALATVAAARKLNPDPLNEFWVVNLTSLLEMPGTYPSPSPRDDRPSSPSLREIGRIAGETLAKARVGEDFDEDLRTLQSAFARLQEEARS